MHFYSKKLKLLLCSFVLALFNTNSFATEEANFMTKRISKVEVCLVDPKNSDLASFKIEFITTYFDLIPAVSNRNSIKLGYWDAMKLVDISIQDRKHSQVLKFESTSKQNAIYYCNDVRSKVLEQVIWN